MKTTPHTTGRRPLSALVCAVAVFATAGFAQTETHAVDHSPSTSTTAPTDVRTDTRSDLRSDVKPAMSLNHTDRHFLEKAMKADDEDLMISQVALERSENADVKRFAQMVVDDHTRANEELASFAQKHNIDLRAKDVNQDKWRKRDGKDFDRDYIKKMVSDHKDAVELFQKEAKDGTDPELLDFARKELPKLEHHYEAANDLKKMVR
jgi:putative membrane protein